MKYLFNQVEIPVQSEHLLTKKPLWKMIFPQSITRFFSLLASKKRTFVEPPPPAKKQKKKSKKGKKKSKKSKKKSKKSKKEDSSSDSSSSSDSDSDSNWVYDKCTIQAFKCDICTKEFRCKTHLKNHEEL